MSEEKKDEPIVKISMQQMCKICMNHKDSDMQGSITPKGMVYCRLWNFLKNETSVCPNFQ